MKLTCNRQLLVKVIKDILPATVSRSTLPILSNVLIENNNDGTITIRGTNLEYSISITLEVEFCDTKNFVVDAKFFHTWLSNQNTESVTITLNDSNVVLQSGKSKTKLNVLSSDEFPVIRDDSESNIVIEDIPDFISALSQVSIATSNSPQEVRQYTRGAYAVISEKRLTLTGTNSIFLISRIVDVKESSDTVIGIIPSRCITPLVKILADCEGLCNLYVETDKHVNFMFSTKQYKSVQFKTQLIVCNYPDYKRIVPKTNDLMAVLSKSELICSVNMAMLFATDDIERVYFEFDEQGLHIKSTSYERGEYEDYITAITIFGAIKNAFILNGNLFLSWLKSQNTDNVQIECRNGEKNHVVLRGAENSDKGFAVLPPMVIRE